MAIGFALQRAFAGLQGFLILKNLDAVEKYMKFTIKCQQYFGINFEHVCCWQ